VTALDMARGRYYDKDIDALEATPDESPPRPTVSHSDRFNKDQFSSVVPAREKDIGYDAEADNQSFMNDLASRHPHYVGDQTVHQYRTSPGSASNGR
jgi:hypothetical protein